MIGEMDNRDNRIQEINIESILHRIDLNLLLIFDVLMQEQHVSRAAQRVFLSQPAMSNALNRLRDLFDDPILVRGVNGMQPTARAQALTAPLRAILQQIAHTVQPEQPFDPSSAQHRFNIAMNDYGESIVLPPLVTTLRTNAPQVEIATQVLRNELPEQALERGEVDFVISIDNYVNVPTRLRSYRWIKDDLVCVINRQHKLSSKRMTVNNFLKYHHVYPSPLGLRNNIVDNWLIQQEKHRSISVTTHSYWAAGLICAQSNLILSVPERVAKKLTEQLPLQTITPPKGFPSFHLKLIWHPIYESNPANKWLLSQFKSLSID